MTLIGWIILRQQLDEEMDSGAGGAGDDGELEEAMGQFEAALELNPNNIEALMGKAKVFEIRRDIGSALHIVSEVNIKFGWFMPALVEKTRLLLATNDWEQVRPRGVPMGRCVKPRGVPGGRCVKPRGVPGGRCVKLRGVPGGQCVKP